MNLIEKSLKHFLKKKTKFTEALLVLFLITGGITYANTNIENKATGEGSIAIGKDSEANNISALALGTISQTRGFSAISLGTGAEANSDFSISAGLDSIANGKHSVTIGTESKTHSNSTVAIGPWSEAITSGSIALGEDSKAERYETFGYNPLSNSNIYSMNDIPNFKGNQNIREELILLETELNNKIQEAENLVKERGQAIINGDTNRSQTLLQQLEQNEEKMDDLERRWGELAKQISTWQGTKGVFSIGNDDLGISRQITGVAAGREDTDAVNVAQLKTLKESMNNSSINFLDINTKDDYNDYGWTPSPSTAKGREAIALGTWTTAAGKNSIAIGVDTEAGKIQKNEKGEIVNYTGFGEVAIGDYTRAIKS